MGNEADDGNVQHKDLKHEKKRLIEIDMASVALCRIRYPEMVQGHHLVVVVGVVARLDHRGLLDACACHRFHFRIYL